MGLRTLLNVLDQSSDPRGGPGWVVRPGGHPGQFGGPPRGPGRSGDPHAGPGRVERYSQRSGMGHGTLREVWDGTWTLPDIRDGSRDPPEGPGHVGRPRGGPGQVGGPSCRFGTGQGNLPEVWDGSRDPRGGLVRVEAPREGSGWFGDPPGGPRWVGGPSRRSGTGWGTLPVVQDGSGNLLEVRDGPEHPQGGPGRVG